MNILGTIKSKGKVWGRTPPYSPLLLKLFPKACMAIMHRRDTRCKAENTQFLGPESWALSLESYLSKVLTRCVSRITRYWLVFCLSVVPMLITSCAGKAPPSVDVKTAGDSIVDARESVALARGEGSPEYAPQEFTQAESLLREAQEAIRKGRNRVAADLAFQADIEAKIATALAREAKAERRAEEVRETKLEIIWETMTDEVAAAKARRAIAERTALEAQKEAGRAKAWSDKEIQRAEVELTIARAELEMSLADQAKAPEYADETYAKAKSSLQAAKADLIADDFQEAIAAAEEAARYASNAYIQAKAKLEAEAEEALRVRDRAVAAMTKAEVLLAEAKEALVGQYAQDMYGKAQELLKEVRLALEAKEYDRAESLAEQARVSASSAVAVAEAKEIETQAREALEDARANALDVIAKAERAVTEAHTAGASELANDTHKQAQLALDRARKALLEEDFDAALSLARESISQSAAALATAEAKARQKREIEEIENSIMEEAGKIPETAVRKTDRGVTISIGSALFATGSSQIRSDARPRLKMLAELLKKHSDYKVIIEGHTDSVGSEEANLKISTDRAHNSLRYMVDREGIPLERLSSVGYGESRPIASNINEAGRRQNRRVDIVILTVLVSP